MIEKLIGYLTEHIMSHFDDPQIVNVILELITLFTQNNEDSPLLFNCREILAYVFNRLTDKVLTEPKVFEIGGQPT